MKDGVMKFSVPISSLSPRGLKNLFFSFYNKCELLSKATDGNFFVSRDFCYSIGDGVFKEQLLDKIIVQQEKVQEEAQDEQGETALLGIRIENRTDDYDGDLVFTGFNQSEEQEEQEEQEAVQETAAQEDTVQEDAVQVADKPNFDPELENTPTVGTETAENTAENTEFAAETERTYPLSVRDRAISAFLDYLVNHCNDVKHVALEDEETRIEAAKNEKFAMRAWFTQLGWRGKEDNELRSYFYDNLEGNTVFRTEEDHARWAAKWQPRYFDKHPEMKWVLEKTNPLSQRNQIEAEVESEPASEPEQEQESEVAPESDQNMAEEAEYVAASNLSNLIALDETAEETVAEDSEDSEKSGKLEKSAIADLAEVAEAVSATVDTEESAEAAQEVATDADAEKAEAESSEIAAEPKDATESDIESEPDGTKLETLLERD